MVYAYVFGGPPEKVTIFFTPKRKGVRSWTPLARREDLPDLNILATCRMIHEEAAPLFYGSTQFELHSSHLSTFLSTLTIQMKYIRKVKIQVAGWESTRRALRLLANVKHLESLHLEEHYHRYMHARWLASLVEQFVKILQNKINDREAVCRKITIGRAFEPNAVTHDDFKQEVFRYLKDQPQIEDFFRRAPTSGDAPERRDTGRPKRSVVTKKAISYVEDE